MNTIEHYLHGESDVDILLEEAASAFALNWYLRKSLKSVWSYAIYACGLTPFMQKIFWPFQKILKISTLS